MTVSPDSRPPLRVLLVSSVYPPTIGGPSAQTRHVAHGLRARGVEVAVLTFGEGGDGRDGEVPVVRVDGSTVAGIGGKLAQKAALYRRCRQILERFRPDVVHCQTLSYLGVVASAAARMRRIPVLCKYAGSGAAEHTAGGGAGRAGGLGAVGRLRRGVGETLDRSALALAHRVWVTTPTFRDRLTSDWGVPHDKLLLYPNFLDLAPFGRAAAERGPRPAASASPRRALIVARLVPHKGIHVAVAAMRHLADLPVVLRVVGSGIPAYEAELRRLAAEAGVAGRVEFAGMVAHADLPAEYAAADLLVLPSFEEAFGITLVEAMAAGVPAVASRVGGIPSVVEDGVCGRLVSPGDERALAGAMRDLLTRPVEYDTFVRAARSRAARFGLEEGLDMLVEWYSHLAHSARRSRVA